MTLEELLKIVKEKRKNAENDYIREMHKNKKYPYELKGALDTYDDLICLIESKMEKVEK